VQLALDGQTALDLIAASPPDLILLDLMMPEMNGWDVMRALRARSNGKRIPVIVISADRDIADKAQSVQADGYLAKPFKVSKLLDTLAGHLAP
jgi:CheY-like chemotaxis protein